VVVMPGMTVVMIVVIVTVVVMVMVFAHAETTTKPVQGIPGFTSVKSTPNSLVYSPSLRGA
jgi:hypothetical protein